MKILVDKGLVRQTPEGLYYLTPKGLNLAKSLYEATDRNRAAPSDSLTTTNPAAPTAPTAR